MDADDLMELLPRLITAGALVGLAFGYVIENRQWRAKFKSVDDRLDGLEREQTRTHVRVVAAPTPATPPSERPAV